MSRNTLELSRGNCKDSVLDQLLERLDLNYGQFASYLGVNRETLYQYRSGKREFRLSMEQIHKLEDLLDRVGWRLRDLPPDWIRASEN